LCPAESEEFVIRFGSDGVGDEVSDIAVEAWGASAGVEARDGEGRVGEADIGTAGVDVEGVGRVGVGLLGPEGTGLVSESLDGPVSILGGEWLRQGRVPDVRVEGRESPVGEVVKGDLVGRAVLVGDLPEDFSGCG
jgi:hypothetical protein